MREKEYHDKELGRILVKPNSRAKHIIFRNRAQNLYITIPPQVNEIELWEVIERYRVKLMKSGKEMKRRRIDLNYTIDATYFHLSLIQGKQKRFLACSEPGKMVIICPPDTNFDNEALQQWLRKAIEEALRKNAKNTLPLRLKILSEKVDLPYNSLKVNSSKGRWGSCSTKKNINLSYYLLLLPQHLIDYVLLHELAHTKEMNHGEKFWELLNCLTDGKAFELRKELKKYKIDF